MLNLAKSTNAQSIVSIVPNSAMPGEDVTLRVTASTDVQFSYSCGCSSGFPKCVSLKKSPFQMIFASIDFSLMPWGQTNMPALATITVGNDKPNFFDINFKVPPNQKFGWYQMTIISTSGSDCRLVKREAFLVGTVNSISPTQKENISLSPNPANDFIEINMPNAVATTVQFFNMTNQFITEQQVDEQGQRLCVSFLNKGIYYVRFVRNGKILGIQKLIIS